MFNEGNHVSDMSINPVDISTNFIADHHLFTCSTCSSTFDNSILWCLHIGRCVKEKPFVTHGLYILLTKLKIKKKSSNKLSSDLLVSSIFY